MRGLVLLLLYIRCASAQESVLPTNFQGKLTSERGGPPPGAQFVPIPVVDIPPFTGPKPMTKKPKVGQPPPPPPPISSIKPARRPKKPNKIVSPTHIAPPPPAKPVPVDQTIPQGSSGDVPALPPTVTVVTPMTEVRPDQETVSTVAEVPTTTPRTRDHLPASYQRFISNDDLSYSFDFEAPNSVVRSEQGFFKRDTPSVNPVHVKTGMYSFVSPEGVMFRVDYVADERGYRTFMSSQ